MTTVKPELTTTSIATTSSRSHLHIYCTYATLSNDHCQQRPLFLSLKRGRNTQFMEKLLLYITKVLKPQGGYEIHRQIYMFLKLKSEVKNPFFDVEYKDNLRKETPGHQHAKECSTQPDDKGDCDKNG
jgi:hypothetical protein